MSAGIGKDESHLGDVGDVSGKVAIVTGSNTGIGREIALGLAKKNATVILACRSLTKATQAIEYIKSEVPDAIVTSMELDLASFSSVREFVSNFTKSYKALHYLVCNAGLNTMDNMHQYTTDGFELCWQVNFLGHYLLTRLLLPSLKAGGEGVRAVFLTSTMHRAGHTRWAEVARRGTPQSYACSKLAMLMLALELERREPWLIATATNPGAVNSDIYRTLSPTVMTVVGPCFRMLFLSTEQGAATSLRGCLDSSLRGGEYITPYWIPDYRTDYCCCGWQLPFELIAPFQGALVARAAPMAYDETAASELWDFAAADTGC